jgi:hypothetical protein
MVGIGMVWKVVRTAATKIPWGQVIESAPVVVDMVGRARAHMTALPHQDFHVQLKSVQEENLRLAQSLQQTVDHLQEVSETLQVMEAREKLLIVGTAISLLIAISALALVLFR